MQAKVLATLHSGIPVALFCIAVGCGKGDAKKTEATRQTSDTTEESPAESEPAKATVRRPAGAVDRCQWNLATLTGNYLETGHRDPAWDGPATNALAMFARIRCEQGQIDESQRSLIAGYCSEAIAQGCGDPLILYLHTRYVLGHQDGMTDAVMGEAYKKAASAIRKYPCAKIREFYIALRTSEAINYATGNKATSPDVHRFRRHALTRLMEALQEGDMPVAEAYEACLGLLEAVSNNPVQYTEFFKAVEPILMQQWPDGSLIYLLKGGYHIHEAWRARGSGFADTVTEDGWKKFSEHLEHAARALEKAWSLDPSNPVIATELMRVELGQGKGRRQMETWFGRAMALDTNRYDACTKKLNYLEPKWHGSPQDMLAFGRECVASTKWGGRIPLILMDAHVTLAAYAKREGNTNYWKIPVVWRDLRSSYEKFFALNPEAFGWRHNYARHAYWCEQWDTFNQQLTLFGPTNYSFFGGKKQFEQMVRTAQKKAPKRR